VQQPPLVTSSDEHFQHLHRPTKKKLPWHLSGTHSAQGLVRRGVVATQVRMVCSPAAGQAAARASWSRQGPRFVGSGLAVSRIRTPSFAGEQLYVNMQRIRCYTLGDYHSETPRRHRAQGLRLAGGMTSRVASEASNARLEMPTANLGFRPRKTGRATICSWRRVAWGGIDATWCALTSISPPTLRGREASVWS